MAISSTLTSCLPHLPQFLNNKVIFFTGFPGSGKGTQGKKLVAILDAVHLSTGELFRREARSGSDIGAQMKKYMDQGKVIPKELTFSYLEQELNQEKYRRGILLDGYPKNIESFDHLFSTLKRLQITPLAAIHFDTSRQIVCARLLGRLHCGQCELDYPKNSDHCDACNGQLKARSDDTPVAIEKRLDVFEENTSPVIKCFKDREIYHRIDASKPPEEVQKDIIDVISSLWRYEMYQGGSYFLRPPVGQEKSSVFHNHIDARCHLLVREIISEIEAGSRSFENKLYPISHLYLGPQYSNQEFSSVYQKLPNFHPICSAQDEAFSTGKMGSDGFDYDQVKKTLDVAFAHPGQGVMTELEEETFEQIVHEDGRSEVVLDRGNTPYTIHWDKLPGYRERQIKNVPRFELHHGFDIKKHEKEENPPIDIAQLSRKTTSVGFETGGWFIFRKEGYWAYRSNQFSNDDYQTCLDTLKKQGEVLRKIVPTFIGDKTFSSSSSLEKVHAIWRVE